MNPAFSVIFLTTLIGAAQGLFLALFGVQLAGLASPEFLAAGGVVALALTVAGLVSSFFHLGRPERHLRQAHVELSRRDRAALSAQGRAGSFVERARFARRGRAWVYVDGSVEAPDS